MTTKIRDEDIVWDDAPQIDDDEIIWDDEVPEREPLTFAEREEENIRRARESIQDTAGDVIRGTKALGYGAMKGVSGFWGYLDDAATILSEVTGMEKGGALERLAEMADPDNYMDYRPEGLPEKIVSGVARAPGDIAKFILTPGGTITSMGVVGATEGAAHAIEEGADTEEVLKKAALEGAKGAAMGGIIRGAGALPKSAHIPVLGGTFGGQTALEGGDAEEIAEATAVGGILGVAGGKQGLPRDVRRAIKKQKRAEKALKEMVELEKELEREVETVLDKEFEKQRKFELEETDRATRGEVEDVAVTELPPTKKAEPKFEVVAQKTIQKSKEIDNKIDANMDKLGRAHQTVYKLVQKDTSKPNVAKALKQAEKTRDRLIKENDKLAEEKAALEAEPRQSLTPREEMVKAGTTKEVLKEYDKLYEKENELSEQYIKAKPFSKEQQKIGKEMERANAKRRGIFDSEVKDRKVWDDEPSPALETVKQKIVENREQMEKVEQKIFKLVEKGEDKPNVSRALKLAENKKEKLHDEYYELTGREAFLEGDPNHQGKVGDPNWKVIDKMTDEYVAKEIKKAEKKGKPLDKEAIEDVRGYAEEMIFDVTMQKGQAHGWENENQRRIYHDYVKRTKDIETKIDKDRVIDDATLDKITNRLVEGKIKGEQYYRRPLPATDRTPQTMGTIRRHLKRRIQRASVEDTIFREYLNALPKAKKKGIMKKFSKMIDEIRALEKEYEDVQYSRYEYAAEEINLMEKGDNKTAAENKRLAEISELEAKRYENMHKLEPKIEKLKREYEKEKENYTEQLMKEIEHDITVVEREGTHIHPEERFKPEDFDVKKMKLAELEQQGDRFWDVYHKLQDDFKGLVNRFEPRIRKFFDEGDSYLMKLNKKGEVVEEFTGTKQEFYDMILDTKVNKPTKYKKKDGTIAYKKGKKANGQITIREIAERVKKDDKYYDKNTDLVKYYSGLFKKMNKEFIDNGIWRRKSDVKNFEKREREIEKKKEVLRERSRRVEDVAEQFSNEISKRYTEISDKTRKDPIDEKALEKVAEEAYESNLLDEAYEGKRWTKKELAEQRKIAREDAIDSINYLKSREPGSEVHGWMDKSYFEHLMGKEKFGERKPEVELDPLLDTPVKKDIAKSMLQDYMAGKIAGSALEGRPMSKREIENDSVDAWNKVAGGVNSRNPNNVFYKEYLSRLKEVGEELKQRDHTAKKEVPEYKAAVNVDQIKKMHKRIADDALHEFQYEIHKVITLSEIEGKAAKKKAKKQQKEIREKAHKKLDEALDKMRKLEDLRDETLESIVLPAAQSAEGVRWRVDPETGERYYRPIRKNGKEGPRIYQRHVDAVLKMQDYEPGITSSFETAPRTIRRFGEEIYEVVYRDALAAQSRIAADNKLGFQMLGEIKDQLPKKKRAKSVHGIGQYAIAQQKQGMHTLKEMGVKHPERLRLTETQMKVYNQLREIYDAYHKQINELREMAGLDPLPYVENYFTWIRDAKDNGLSPMTMSVEQFRVLHAKHLTTPFRFGKQRSGKRAAKLETDVFKIMGQYMTAFNRYKHMMPLMERFKAMRDGVLTEKGIVKMVDIAPNATKYLTDWLAFQNGVEVPSLLGRKADHLINKLNRNIAFAVLSANVRSALIQPSAIRNAVVEIGPKYMAKGAKSLLSADKRNFAMEKSKHLNSRIFDRLLQDIAEEGGFSGKVGRAAEWGMKGLQVLDMQTAKATWWGAYLKAIEKDGMSERKAINYADDVVIRTQASGARTDISPVQRSALGKSMTALQTFVINDFGFLMHDVFGVGNRNISRKQAFKKALGYTAATAIVNMLYEDVAQINSPYPRPIDTIIDGIREGKDVNVIAMDEIKELLEPVPIIGGPARYGRGSPLLDTIVSMFKHRGLNVEQAEYVLRLMGIPATSQAFKYIRNRMRGEDHLRSLVGKYRTKEEIKRGRRGSGSVY